MELVYKSIERILIVTIVSQASCTYPSWPSILIDHEKIRGVPCDIEGIIDIELEIRVCKVGS